MRVACIQMRSGTDPAANAAIMGDLVSEAAAQGAQYVQTPEMTGLLEKNPKRLLEIIEPEESDPSFLAAGELAKRHGIWLHLGSTAIRREETGTDGRAANRGGVFSPDGTLVATYDKIHMFDVAVDENNRWQESARYAPGERAVTVDAGFARIGLSICYDIRFPQLYRQLAKAGAAILTCPAAFTRPTGKAHWETLLRARAIENGAFMIAAAQGGVHEDGRETWGHSTVVGPWGEIVGRLDHDEPGVLVCDIDLEEAASARRRLPVLENERRFAMTKV
ncbi:MAG: carbon-nitrogen hydrolase family protein [Phyllobacteriaceae bacterium]|nr:carbon-nitrogen hydrolase family protein [Phyllobacteriaceae bacterium]